MDVRAFAKALRCLPRTELERLCKDSGMNEREVYAVVSYVYDRKTVDRIAADLNISVSTYHYKKETLALKLRNYLWIIKYPLEEMMKF